MAEQEIVKNAISISLKRRRVLIYKSALRSIGAPKNIRFLLNTRKKRIAVQACEAIDRDSFNVPDLKELSNTQYEITSITFVNMLYKMAGWNSELVYRIMGEVYPDNRLIEFALERATVIADDEFADPENAGS